MYLSHEQFPIDRAVYKYIVLCIIIMIVIMTYIWDQGHVETFLFENAWFPQPRHERIAIVSAHFFLMITTSNLFGHCDRNDIEISGMNT